MTAKPLIPSTRARDLIALAERVEQASGPDRELDALIYWAVRDHQPKSGGFAEHAMKVAAPRYTASLDAAMTLNDWDWLVSQERGDPAVASVPKGDAEIMTCAATPALALTAAALRAQSATLETSHETR